MPLASVEIPDDCSNEAKFQCPRPGSSARNTDRVDREKSCLDTPFELTARSTGARANRISKDTSLLPGERTQATARADGTLSSICSTEHTEQSSAS